MSTNYIAFGGVKSTSGKLLTSIVGQKKLADFDCYKRNKFSAATLRYVMQTKSMSETRVFLAELGFNGQQNKMFSKAVRDLGELNLALRQVFLIALHRQRCGKPVKIDKLLEKANLPEEDEELFWCLPNMKIQGEMQGALQRIKEFPLLMPDDIKHQSGVFVEEMRRTNFFRNVIRKKLTFVANGNNFKLEDFETELQMKAVQVFYRSTPYFSQLHRENKVRRSVLNYVEYLIKHYTAGKRARTQRSEDGEFFRTVRTLSTQNLQLLADDNGGMNERDDLMYQSAMLTNSINQDTNLIEVAVTIEKYVKSGTPGREVLVNLLLLQEHPAFAQFVIDGSRLRAVTTPEDVFLKVGQERYFSLIAEFLKIPNQTVIRVALELKTLLSDHGQKM